MTLPPPKCGERGAFYPVFERSELSAAERYTIAIPATPSRPWPVFPCQSRTVRAISRLHGYTWTTPELWQGMAVALDRAKSDLILLGDSLAVPSTYQGRMDA